MYRVPRDEMRDRGGPATRLVDTLRRVPEELDKLEQRHCARRAARGDAPEVFDQHWRDTLALAARLYDVLHRIVLLTPAARRVEREYISYRRRNNASLSRHQVALRRHYDRYLWERGTNHVREEWERAREVEAQESRLAYEEWLRQEERRRVEEELHRWAVMRFGWREEDVEGFPGVKVYRRYKTLPEKRDASDVRQRSPAAVETLLEESEDYPLYRFEEEMVARVIGRAIRVYLARTAVHRLRRAKLREEKERLERAEWEEAERLADQHVTVRLPVLTVSAARHFADATDILNDSAYVAGQDDPPCDNHLDLWVGFLLDARTPARPVVEGAGVSTRRINDPVSPAAKTAEGGTSSRIARGMSPRRGAGTWRGASGDGWMRAEVSTVNPCEVVSSEGIQRYPRGTFGIRYLDSGEEFPDVPRDCLRVLTLTSGMKVEVRYKGGPDYYPGVIKGANERAGRVLSYQVEYDDGELEKAAMRGNITPFPEEVAAVDATTAEARRRGLLKLERAKWLQHQRAGVAASWRDRTRKAEEDYLAAAATGAAFSTGDPGEKVVSVTAEGEPGNRGGVGIREASGRKDNERPVRRGQVRGNLLLGDGPRTRRRSSSKGIIVGGEGDDADQDAAADEDALACIGMIEAAARFREETRPRAIVAVKIEYTRQCTRFGFAEVRTSSGTVLWKCRATGAVTKSRPRYAFEEDIAAGRIQTSWAGFRGRKAFRKRLAEESIRGVALAGIAEASSHAWVGHKEEGLTVEMWLLRAGVSPQDARRVAGAATKVVPQLSGTRAIGGGKTKGKGGSSSSSRTKLSALGVANFRSWLKGVGRRGAGDGSGNSPRRGDSAAGIKGSREEKPGTSTSASGDAKLVKLGLESPLDRRRVMAIATGEDEAPQLVNWFEGPDDARSVSSVIAAGEPKVFKVIWKAFPGNQSRAENMAKKISVSAFPVTRTQISAWLNRHEGRPGVAQSAMAEQIVEVAVLGSRAAEAKAYDVYGIFCRRLSMLASNMKLKGLKMIIDRAFAKADLLLAETEAALAGASSARAVPDAGITDDSSARPTLTPRSHETTSGQRTPSMTASSSPHHKSGNTPGQTQERKVGTGTRRSQRREESSSGISVREPTQRAKAVTTTGGRVGSPSSAESTWAHARAALVLRTEVVATALRWVAGAETIQVAFRGFRCRRSHRALLAWRKRAAVIIQAFERQRQANATAEHLLAQRASAWEQLWDHDSNRAYFYDGMTGESCWEDPGVPYRPLTRERKTGKLIQAWPQLEQEMQEGEGPMPGYCMICRTEKATRVCNQCVRPSRVDRWRQRHRRYGNRRDDPEWGEGQWHLCFACFAEHHAREPELACHTFTPVGMPDTEGWLECSLCGGAASRRCKGLELPPSALLVAVRMLDRARTLAALPESDAPHADSSSCAASATLASPRSTSHSASTRSPAVMESTSSSSRYASRSVEGRSELAGAGERQHPEGGKRLRREKGPPVTREEFKIVLEACCLSFSVAWTEATYEACLGGGAGRGGHEGELNAVKGRKRKRMRTPVEFWSAFVAALEAAGDDCDDILCGGCWERVHRRGLRAKHRWEGFKEGARRCEACLRAVAERNCPECEVLLCSPCFAETHARGKRRQHAWTEILEEPVDQPRCRECARRVGNRECRDGCKANLCDSCEAFVHPGVCPKSAVAGGGERSRRDGGSLGAKPSGGGHFSRRGGHLGPDIEGAWTEGKSRFRPGSPDAEVPSASDALGDIRSWSAPGVADGSLSSTGRNTDGRTGELLRLPLDDGEADMPIACDVCGKPPDIECQQCGTVYCSKTWVGNPGCFKRDHERGNRRHHTAKRYTYGEELVAKAEAEGELAKEHEERAREREQAIREREAEREERLARISRERQAKREQRLMREAEEELRLRHQRRRARALRVRPKLLPGLQFPNSEYFGSCFSLPSLDGLRDRLLLTSQRLPGRIMEKMKTIRRTCED